MSLSPIRRVLRSLLKSPVFTTATILTLMLGIGANSAMFNIVNAVLLKPLPYEQPGQLVKLSKTGTEPGWEAKSSFISPANYFDWRELNQVFSEMGAYTASESGNRTSFNLTGRGEPERVQGCYTTPSVLEMTGVHPLLGRLFRPEEDENGQNMVVILSYGLWQRRFGGKGGIIGSQIGLNGESRTVVGVMPPGFEFPTSKVELWMPFGWGGPFLDPTRRGLHFLQVVARMKEGVSLERAEEDMRLIAQRLEQGYPDSNAGMGVELKSFHEWRVGEVRKPLMILLGAVAFVLLVACVNVVNLLLSRALVRRRELSLRQALGAKGWRLVGSAMGESLVLFVLGGIGALMLGNAVMRIFVALVPSEIPRLENFEFDLRVVAFTFLVTLFAGLLCVVAPALDGLRTSPIRALRDEGRPGAGGGVDRQRSHRLLIVGEVTVTFVLLVAFGLMLQSFYKLRRIDPGFHREGQLTVEIALPWWSYREDHEKQRFYSDLLRSVRELPGVEAAGTTSLLPLEGFWWNGAFTLEGHTSTRSADRLTVNHKELSPGYFETMGIPLLAGRDFTDADDAGSSPVVIVNDALVKTYMQGIEPVGRRVKFAGLGAEAPWRRIVGVVRGEKQVSLVSESEPEIYAPIFQEPQMGATLVIRVAGEARAMIDAVRRVVSEIDPDLPIYNIQTIDQILDRSIARERFALWLLGAFAGVALLLAMGGIYGVVAYSMRQRTREIGIRMALGADTSDILKTALGSAMQWIGLGIAFGLFGSWAMLRLLKSFLYEVDSTDPLTYALMAVVLTVAAVLATFAPARRASRLDPIKALRQE